MNRPICELCGDAARSLSLTSDSHPQGPNHMVCNSCLDYDDPYRGGPAPECDRPEEAQSE